MTTNEATATEETEKKPAALAVGQKLAGCYLLKARVSAAGAGELWQANDDVLGRDISLQFIPDKIREDAKAVADVRQEIKRIRQLIHPNILRVYDFIEESDWAAVSMDSFEGESLASMMEKRSSRIFSVSEIEPWVKQLCQTLEDAHKIGLFHRDISPANIYFRPDGRLFLTGFGFSRCVSDSLRRLDGNDNAVSANVSPQLLDGKAAARTDDVYGCGALLFELLTGHAPFSGADIAEQIRNSAPKSLADLRPKDLEPVPESWERAIAASLSKNPAERPPSASKLAERLTVAPASASSILEMLTPAPAEVKQAAAENKEVKESKTPGQPSETPMDAPVQVPVPKVPEAPSSATPIPETPTSEAPATETPKVEAAVAEAPKAEAPVAETPGPAAQTPSSFALGRRNIATTTDPSALSTAPAAKPLPEKALPTESNIPPKAPGATRPKTVKANTYPSVYGDGPRFPMAGLAVAALLVVGALVYFFHGSHKESPSGKASNSTPSITSENPETPPPGQSPGGNPSPDGEKGPSANGNPALDTPDAGVGKPTPAAPGTTPTNAHIAASLPASASPAEKALAQKQEALNKAKQAVAAAEKSVADLTKQQQTAAADAAAAQKALDDKAKTAPLAKKAVDEILAKKKKLEDDQKAAEAAAQQAKQMADDKQRLADAAKQAVDDLVAKNQPTFTALDASDAQLAEMKKALQEKQQIAAAAEKAKADADAARVKEVEAVRASEKEVADATAAITQDQKARDAKKEAIIRLEKEAEDLKQKMKQLEDLRKSLESGAPLPDASTGPVPATPPPVIQPNSSKNTPAPPLPRSSPTSSVPAAATPPALSMGQTPPPTILPPDHTTLLSKVEGPKITINPGPGETPSAAGANSLGQKFVPVGDVDFCIWQTRVKDFEVFARAVGLKSVGWRSPGFKQGPDHPVVNVTWEEAVAFCKWLTDKEHSEGSLPANQFYRLPTDLEWSKAVGLPEEPEKTPAERDMAITDVYPWGTEWPPPPGAGNYTGEETGSDVAIKGYNDGFAWTSPVGSFKPNKFGLYDMGGNVWQWCMDSWNDKSTGKVLRGASWYNGALKLSLLSSCRVHAARDSSTDNYGFRIVKATEGSRAAKK